MQVLLFIIHGTNLFIFVVTRFLPLDIIRVALCSVCLLHKYISCTSIHIKIQKAFVYLHFKHA